MSDTKEKETPIIEEEKLNDQMKVRREKMQEFIDAGVYPFGQKYNWDHHAQEVKDDAVELEKNETVVSVAGGAAASPFKTQHNALDMDIYQIERESCRERV